MATPFDLIVAPITAPGGAVGIVRLSGSGSWDLAERVCKTWIRKPESHRAFFTEFSNGDDGLVLLFAEGKSYTGDESVEFNIHGSGASVRTLVERIVSEGARLARPGEFTERAFLNGNLDLTQAESVNDTVRAATARQLETANAGRSGELKDSLDTIESRLMKILAAIEASVDFSEEIGDVDVDESVRSLTICRDQITELIEKGDRGRVIREGLRIAIVGPPNAGKSSLLNRLLGVQRSIVTDIEGTTRDYVEEQVELGGMLCVLIDTAGLRDTEDTVESIGIQLAVVQAAKADLVWYLYDASGTKPEVPESIPSEKVWWIPNKADLLSEPPVGAISTYTNQGIEALIGRISALTTDISGAIPNARHLGHLRQAEESVEFSIQGFTLGHPSDLVVTHVRTALYEIGQITGSTATDDLLTRIFSDFCIGK